MILQRLIDLSRWTLTVHPAQQTVFSTIEIPAGTRLAAGNAELVTQMVEIAAQYGRRPATAQEARRILGLVAG